MGTTSIAAARKNGKPAKLSSALDAAPAYVGGDGAAERDHSGLRFIPALSCNDETCRDGCRLLLRLTRWERAWRWFQENHRIPWAMRVSRFAEWRGVGLPVDDDERAALIDRLREYLALRDRQNRDAGAKNAGEPIEPPYMPGVAQCQTAPGQSACEVEGDDAPDSLSRQTKVYEQLRQVGLTDQEIVVLSRSRERMSAREIAKLSGVSRNRVPDLLSSALNKITAAGLKLVDIVEPQPKPDVIYVDPERLEQQPAA